MKKQGGLWDQWLRLVARTNGVLPDGRRASVVDRVRAHAPYFAVAWSVTGLAGFGIMGVTIFVALGLGASDVAAKAVGSAAAFVGGTVAVYVMGFRSERVARVRYRLDEERDIRVKTDRLTAALREAAELSTELGDMLETRRNALAQLKADIDRWEAQAKISKEDAAAIQTALAEQLDLGVGHLDSMTRKWGLIAILSGLPVGLLTTALYLILVHNFPSLPH